MNGTPNGYKPQLTVHSKSIYILFGLLILFTITSLALTAAILGVVVNRLDSKSTTYSVDSSTSRPITFADQIKIDDLMKHLGQLQVLADRSGGGGTRAIATSGFNDTLDYITSELVQNTNLIIQHQYFTVRNYIVQGTPELQSEINGTVINHSHISDFAQILFSSTANFDSFVPVVAIPNFGCNDADWTNVSVRDLVALVIRGSCNYVDKSALAQKYEVKGLLIYNDGSTNNLFPIQGVRNNLNTTIPAYFISYMLGIELANPLNNARVIMNIDVRDAEGIGNICADTPTGDKTKTIVVGAHSDSVPAGSGINDNGKIILIN
jgi:hypothetical protein